MSVGLAAKFSILQQSPHDFQPPEAPRPKEESSFWVPSRYNVRAVTTDGRLVLWNSYQGTMSVFPAGQRSAVEELLKKKGFSARPNKIVRYLKDRGFIVAQGTDEYRRVQLGFGLQQYRSDRLELILLASEDCNFCCQYCYEDFARGTMQPRVRSGIKRLVESRLPGLSSLAVSWFGGEPLYGLQAIEDLAPYFSELANEREIAFSSNMTTNGYLLTPEVAARLLSWNIRSYQITLDGPAETHDRSRPTREGQGTFSTILANLQAMREIDEPFAVDIRVNFDRDNHLLMDGFLDRIERDFQGDPRFKVRFRSVGKWGGPNDAALNVCGTDAAEIQQGLKMAARKRGLELSDDIRQIHGLGAQVCYAARPYSFIIGASGKVMKCTVELDKNDRNVVAELDEEGHMVVDPDKFALWTAPAFERDPQCQKCVVLPTCQGAFCPMERFDSGESPCTPLRMSVKQELRDLVEECGDRGRALVIENRAADPSSPSIV